MTTILIAVFLPLSLIGLSWLMLFGAPRLLGVRVGPVRSVLAALVGWFASGLFTRIVPAPTNGHLLSAGGFLTLILGLTLLTAMAFLVLTEMLGLGSWLGPIALLRAQRHRLARARRYSRISAILVRHGLGGLLRGRHGPSRARLGRSLRLALEEAGGTFVKLGQVLSTRRDLLPAEIADELEKLQSDVAPAPWPAVRALLTEELGAPVELVFAEFDPVPLAAASIAQVHRARLTDGAEVVVKVQRPGIRTTVDQDLDIIRRIAVRIGAGCRVGAVELADGFATALREELDFRVEARNIAAVAATITDEDAGMRLPVVHTALSTARVLVMDRLDGVPLGAAEPVLTARGLDRPRLARTLLNCVLRQVVVHGVFHADPHPGNILLLADGWLGLLDFGSVGRLDSGLRAKIGRLLLAVDGGDPQDLRAALLDVVQRTGEVDEQALDRELGRFSVRHLAPGTTPDASMFSDLFRLVAAHRLAAPPELAAVFRALTTLDGTLRRLAPGFDILAEARRFAGDQFTGGFLPMPAARAAGHELRSLLPVLRELPRRIDRIAGTVEQGRLAVRVRLFGDEPSRRFVTGLVHQVLLTVVGCCVGIMAVLLLGITGGPMVTTSTSVYQVVGWNLLVVSAGLVLRVVVGTVRRTRSYE